MPGLATSLVVALAICGQDPAGSAAELEGQVARLVRQLDAVALAEREGAEAALLELGPDALPLLPASGDTALSAEARKRVARVRRQLELAATERMTEATRVTLTEASRDLPAILADIEKQTGNRMFDFRERFGQEALALDAPVDLKIDGEPFWPAIDKLLDAASLDLYGFAGEPGLAVIVRSPTGVTRQGRCAYSGAFRIEPISIQATRDLREQGSHWLALRLDVAWEPRLSLVALKQPLAEMTIADDAGGTITYEKSDVELELALDATQSSAQLDLQLEPPDVGARRLAKVTGRMYAMLATGEHEFSFDKLEEAKQIEQRFGEAVVVLERVRKNDAVWEVRMAVRFAEPTAALESHRGWIFNNRAVLIGPAGQVVEPATMETTRRTEQDLGLAYLFDLPEGPAGYRFVYRTATSIRVLPVRYELRDIELP